MNSQTLPDGFQFYRTYSSRLAFRFPWQGPQSPPFRFVVAGKIVFSRMSLMHFTRVSAMKNPSLLSAFDCKVARIILKAQTAESPLKRRLLRRN